MGIFGERVDPHPTPEAALNGLQGLSSSELSKLIQNAVNNGEQVAPQRAMDRYYLAEIAGFKYNFHYYLQHILGASYRLRDQEENWAIEFRSSARYPDGALRNSPYVMMPLITVTERVCFDFYLRGDKDRFRSDMTKLKLFL